jgi:hypothetical protein
MLIWWARILLGARQTVVSFSVDHGGSPEKITDSLMSNVGSVVKSINVFTGGNIMKVKSINLLAAIALTFALGTGSVAASTPVSTGTYSANFDVVKCIMDGNGVAYCAQQAWG